MQITLDSSEIKQAIVSFVRDQGIDLTNTDVEVGMTAGRGVNGTTATVDIIPKRNTKGVTGVKTTFHSVTNLTPGQTPRGTVASADAEEEEGLDEEITDPVLNDAEETEEVEDEAEDAPVAATNSIFN